MVIVFGIFPLLSPYGKLTTQQKIGCCIIWFRDCTFVLDFVCFLSRLSFCPSGFRALVGTEKSHRISFIRSLWKTSKSFFWASKIASGIYKNVRGDLLFSLSYSKQKHWSFNSLVWTESFSEQISNGATNKTYKCHLKF